MYFLASVEAFFDDKGHFETIRCAPFSPVSEPCLWPVAYCGLLACERPVSMTDPWHR
jgi:hypothetical protein